MQLANESINLLNKKDIEFLYNYEAEINNIDTKLNIQNSKKEQVLNIISKSNSAEADKILNAIRENINLLTSLKNDLLNLDNFIVNFMIKLNSTTLSENKEIEILQDKINDISTNSANAEHTVFTNDMKIDKFMNLNSNIRKNNSAVSPYASRAA